MNEENNFTGFESFENPSLDDLLLKIESEGDSIIEKTIRNYLSNWE